MEHPRVVLTGEYLARIVRDQVEDRHDTLARIGPDGPPGAIAALRAEIAVLERYV